MNNTEDATRAFHQQVRAEVTNYLALMQKWGDSEPDIVLREIASVAARLTEIRVLLLRDNSQRANRLRLNEIDPVLDQTQFQFKIASRRQTVRSMEWEVSRGQ